MAIPTNDRLPDEIEGVLIEYEKLFGESAGIESSTSEPDINTYISQVVSEVRQMRDNELFRNN